MGIIERLVKDLGNMSAKILANKEGESEELTVDMPQLDSLDLLGIKLQKMVANKEYNEAEEIIFDSLETNPSDGMYELAIDFYNLLLSKSDNELSEGNFTRDEIFCGIEDIKKFKIDENGEN